MRALEIKDLCLAIDGTTLVEDLSFSVRQGETVTLMGKSGCGKSSLLAWLGGFLDPAFVASGVLLLNGQNLTTIPAFRRRIGLLFQDPVLYEHLSIAENLMFAMPRSLKGLQNRLRLAEQTLKEAGLGGMGGRRAETLSGGQKARVALLRTFLAKPDAVLLDEPFRALDQELRQQMREHVKSSIKNASIPAILVTHDPEDAVYFDGPLLKPWEKPLLDG